MLYCDEGENTYKKLLPKAILTHMDEKIQIKVLIIIAFLNNTWQWLMDDLRFYKWMNEYRYLCL